MSVNQPAEIAMRASVRTGSGLLDMSKPLQGVGGGKRWNESITLPQVLGIMVYMATGFVSRSVI
jgi:hypothetical protein